MYAARANVKDSLAKGSRGSHEPLETTILRLTVIIYSNLVQLICLLSTCVIPFQVWYWLVATSGILCAFQMIFLTSSRLAGLLGFVVASLATIALVVPMHSGFMAKRRPFSLVKDGGEETRRGFAGFESPFVARPSTVQSRSSSI